jgi:phosphoglucosamine mutase
VANAVAAGICAAGVDVIRLGVLPTPGVAYLTRDSGAVAGVVISASHNPYPDNGIKLFDSNGYKLSDHKEALIEALLQQPGQALNCNAADGIGTQRQWEESGDSYLRFLLKALPDLSLDGMTLVLDCAHGATHAVAPQLFQALGAQVTALFCQPNGTNINEQCGSQHPEILARSVVQHKADLGLAFDGDGDRLIAVDPAGKVLSGDQIMAICARDLQQKGRLKNNTVVSTVMSNLGFGLALKELGIELHATQVGDRYVMEQMKTLDAVLGGEDSGHLIFLDKHTTGDGLMAALGLLDAVQTAGESLSTLSKIMKVYPQELINVNVRSKPDLNTLPEIVAAIGNVENELADQGRVLVRYSGTQPMCRAMVEGPTLEVTRKHCQYLASVIRKTLGCSRSSICYWFCPVL